MCGKYGRFQIFLTFTLMHGTPPIVQKEYILPDASLPILPVFFRNFIVNEFVLGTTLVYQ